MSIHVTGIIKDLQTPMAWMGEGDKPLESFSPVEARRMERELAVDIKNFLNSKGFRLMKVKVSQKGKTFEI